ncbi:DUF6415 family natural product biosynthesis protein [Streptomyces sp. NPDC001595]|uniref:DUF6415 family natural product biosynthesis protein n=1 Tax=Streptomyces sp. NPDC001532 TaxID=3154520 RepID=UPI0033214E15
MPGEEELNTLTLQLRGHLMLAIPAVEALAAGFPEDDVPRACAHAGVMQARTRLDAPPGRNLPQRVKQAQQLARSVNALCDHYENLAGEQPAVLDEKQAALLRWWNHCLDCQTCSALDDAGRNANFHCPDAHELYQAYRRAGRPVAPAVEERP